ncbi:MAG: hypothetical protein J0H14_11630 [Alphaproteobacteria bacterium]|nr:hypothetical protein [Alphaproteobacteria bacterium]
MATPVSLLARAAGMALACCLIAVSVRAMTVQRIPVKGSDVPALLLQGRIVKGDAARLTQALRGEKFSAVLLNSPGGSVLEARDMARAIRALRVPVVVPDRAVCASACFMLFAAGRDRVAEPGAMIGVHSASVAGGNETMDTLGVTTLMAREAAQYGVPPAITGRMVTTAPGQMAWLTRGELEQMGVRIAPTRAAASGRVLPGSGVGEKSDWTRGFEHGQAVGEGGSCAPPAGIANKADFALGCASGQRAGTARVAGAPPGSGGKSDWTRGFEFGRAKGAGAACDTPEQSVANRRDWSLGCESGRKAAGG